MKIETVNIDTIKPYENNAKLHPAEQIEQIKKSIEDFGNNDPIAIDSDSVIIEGHGRYIALKELGFEKVEVIRLGHLSEEQRKAYALIHNKLTMNSDFDFDLLEAELAAIDIDMEYFGFEKNTIDWAGVDDLTEENYEEPEKDKLKCPRCGHIDTKAHFMKVTGEEATSAFENTSISEFTVRKATLNDIDKIKVIADDNTKQIGFVLRPALEENAKKGCILVAADEENNILGFCNFNARKDGVNVVYEVCTDYKYRGKGVGKALIDAMPRPIRLKCPVDNKSNNFYEKYGFDLVEVEDGKKRRLNVWEIK